MHDARTTFWILTAGAALALAGCGDPADDPPGAGADAGTHARADAGRPDAAPPDAACQPKTCFDLGDVCGPQPDGCGGVLDCRPCECTPDTFAEDCAAMACQVATGCAAGRCTYAPVTCGGAACGVPEVGDASPQACGDAVCAAQYCDPAPTVTADGATYANRCVPFEEVACGTCGLGRLSCGEGGPECDGAPPLFGLDPAQVSCTDDPATSTFVFVDPAATATVADGTRARPYADFQTAMDAAVIGAKRGIVIGGAPRIEAPLSVVEGISVYGGYAGAPEWRPDPSLRPDFQADVDDADDHQVVGGWADGIVLPTGIVNVRIAGVLPVGSVGDPDGRSAIGLVARRASGLVLRRVILVGLAEGGRDGAAGPNGPSPLAPPFGGLRAFLYSGAGCSARTITHDGGAGGIGGICHSGTRPDGGDGATADTTDLGYVAGEDGAGDPRGGIGGSQSGPPGNGAEHPEPTAQGGADGIDDAAAWDARRGVFSVALGRGQDGRPGLNGRGGGGGRAGFTSDRRTVGGDVTGCRLGGGGGGGGAGGCGGTGGIGGGAGGWAIALLAIDSAGLTVESSTLAGGVPGRGGRGGAGGRGSAGQAGAAGGASTDGFDVTGGQDGGDGSDGQDGGRGGDGADGHGVGLQCVGPAPQLESVVFTPPVGFSPFHETRGCAP
jgi:hypothetical protein